MTEGVTVLRGGTSQAEGTSPYLPFLEALGEYIAGAPTDQLCAQLGQHASSLATLFPEITARLGPLSSGEVHCPFEFPDLETAVRGLMSTGVMVAAARQVEDAAVRRAITESLAPFRMSAGDYRPRNTFRKRSERFRGTAALPFCFRKPYSPGWALVGDAGYRKDLITAEGIRDAELLTDALDAGLSGRRPLEAALADYEQQRNETAMPIYDFTYQLALEPPPPEMQQLFAALPHDQEQAERFFGTITGTVPIPDFFAPENLGRIMEARAGTDAAVDAPGS